MIIGASIGGIVVIFIIIFVVLLYMRRRNTSGGLEGIAGDRTGALADDQGQIAETCEVIFNYVPNLSDEIYLYVGDKVIVKVKFDDGWAMGYNMSTKQEGSFPLACVAPFSSNGRPISYSTQRDSAKISQRASSLYVPK